MYLIPFTNKFNELKSNILTNVLKYRFKNKAEISPL